MTEAYLWAALALMHLLGAWLSYAIFEDWIDRQYRKHTPAFDFALCFLIWELIALWVIFEKTTPKKGNDHD